MKFKLNRETAPHFLMMLGAVLMMGFSLSLLVLTHFGTDPCSAMNYGITRFAKMAFGERLTIGGFSFPITFGNCQLAFNLILLFFMLLFYRSVIGWGTLGNMILVGYTADFFSFIWHDVCRFPQTLDFSVRAAILFPALVLFVTAAACYMHSGQGMAPYDAIPFILDDIIQQKTGKKNFFKPIRYCLDFVCASIGFFTGGEFGAITVLMVLTLAPVVQFVGTLFKRPSIKKANC
ncbi:MAG: hypothetical protein LUH14_12070 [Clostridiaceae bacterium]|nr:hypothetical protein [Clostridiaceae bacterium]